MENKKLKKLTALLLSITMVFSMVVNAFPAALAAGESVSTPSVQDSTASGDMNYSTNSHRPRLYVDFLGDNKNYLNGGTLVSGGALNGLSAPASVNQSKVTNNNSTNTWEGYQNGETYTTGGGSIYDGETIFWVGVGIDRMNLLELLKDGNGIYGLELGLYYDSTYIEPYTGDTANSDVGYKAVLEAANLNSAFTHSWTSDYQILEAHTNMEPQTDPVTQEVIQKPAMTEILSDDTANTWRMTYVSLEYKATNVDSERFKGAYGTEKTDTDTQYIMMIPFRLKNYDTKYTERVCLRLTRSAGLFSISGGEGNSPYAAWERVTTRNPNRELKLMAAFQGDLNIFSGGRYLEEGYSATLVLNQNAVADNGNTATLKVKDDPSYVPDGGSYIPISVNTNGAKINGLHGGIGMQLDVTVGANYKVTVSVYRDGDKNVLISRTEVWADEHNSTYTFVMPEHDVIVDVQFEINDATMFNLYLDEDMVDAGGNTVSDLTAVADNYTTVTATYAAPIDNAIPPTTVTTVTTVDRQTTNVNSNGWYYEKAHVGATVRADVSVHGDYEALVYFSNYAETAVLAIDTATLPADAQAVYGGGAVIAYILPTGGQVTLNSTMPQNEVVFHVTYRPATRHTVALEVYNVGMDTSVKTNVAQLSTTMYDSANEGHKGYSGVVYEDTTKASLPHSQVETDFRVLDLVDVSSATGSGSLGGDGRTPMAWNGSADSLMARLYNAVSATDLSSVTPLDLRWDSAAGVSEGASAAGTNRQPADGLRKNAVGEFYNDTDISDFRTKLYRLKELIMADIAADSAKEATWVTTVTDDSGAVLYSYYNLTREQVQQYLLDWEKYETYQAEQTEYNAAYTKYTADLKAYNDYMTAYKAYVTAKDAAEAAGKKYEGVEIPELPLREPVEPTAPVAVTEPALPAAATPATLSGFTWYTPTAGFTAPGSANMAEAYKLEVRPDRQVAVTLEASSQYEVRKIVLTDRSGGGHADVTVSKNANGTWTSTNAAVMAYSTVYQNEVVFTMPDYDCAVQVYYGVRATHDLTLEIVGNYWYDTNTTAPAAADKTAGVNYVEVTGYIPNPTADSVTAASFDALDRNGDKQEGVLEGSTVTVKVYKRASYTASIMVHYNDGTTDILTASDNDLDNGEAFTFTMPAGATKITVTYSDNTPQHKAYLQVEHANGTTSDANNKGVWQGTTLTELPAREGDALTAEIKVAPGYYIDAVIAYTDSGSYPFTLSGNGWNNGLGAGYNAGFMEPVTIKTTMPDEDYYVRVIVKKGPPSTEPTQFLSLRVNDEKNTAPVDNYATATVGGATILTVGKTKSSMYDLTYTTAGETVTVSIHAEDGFTISSVELEPVEGTVPLTWKSATYATDGRLTEAELEFVMPAVSTTVVVTFDTEVEKRTPLMLNLSKTQNGAVVTGVSTGLNRLLTVTSPTIAAVETAGSLTVPDELPTVLPGGDNTTGIAKKGEVVTLTFEVDKGWYVHSLTLYGDEGGLAYTLTLNDAAKTPYDPATHYSTTDKLTLVATFVMPDSDVTEVVNFRSFTDKPDPNDGKHQLDLVVEDPDNGIAPYADNYASAAVSGSTRTISDLGKGTTGGGKLHGTTTAYVGEEVVISYAAATDYALEVILATSDGVSLPVTYFTESGQVKARFTMPDGDATAVVRFVKGTEKTYTANLVLYYPDGTPVTQYDSVGEGSFRVDPDNGLDSGRSKLYSMTATAGQKLNLDLLAHDGYYIQSVTVTSTALGVTASYTGAFGRQTGAVFMPAADIQINVVFAKGWPDDVATDPDTVGYDLTLRVYDTANSGTKTAADSNAAFVSLDGKALTAPDSDKVYGGESKTISPAYDEDQVVVAINPKAGSYVKSVTVTDSRGYSVPWQYVTGGIVFAMSPAHVTVTVTFAKLDDTVTKTEYNVTLHTDAAADGVSKGTVTVTHPTASETITADGNSFATSISVPAYGQSVKLEVTPETGYYVKTAYAVSRTDGTILPLTHTYMVGTDSFTEVTTGMPQVSKGGTVTFAMPNDNVDVYVYFDDLSAAGAPADGSFVGTLTVVGESGAGSGEMFATETPAVTTGTVSATGAGSLFAVNGTELTVTLNVASGYSIQTLRVTDGYGKDISYTWNADGKSFVLTMPSTNGARVYVELVKNTTDPLTAQVVVNNGGDVGNTATLRYENGGTTISGSYLSPVYAGDTIHLDVTVKAGYQVEYIKIVPAKLGLSATLIDGATVGTIRNQTGSFTMPNEDVVVYVKFCKDQRDRKTVTLIADGLRDTTTGTDGNNADLTNEYTGESGDKTVYPDTLNNGTTVDAAPATTTTAAEWVKVSYRWAEGYCVKTITVRDAAGNSVPFTQNENQTNRTGELRFPMVNSDNVTVTVTWAREDELEKYKAILHVIDLDDPAKSNDSTAKLTWTTETTGDINSVYHSTKDTSLKAGEEYIEVPAGERVEVNIKAQDTPQTTYIKAAYVLYREGGQMIKFNLTPDANGNFVGKHNEFFIMHRGQCDVYVYFTTVQPDPQDYSAVLMLDSDPSDTVSTATISRPARTGETAGASATVTANVNDHGYITAKNPETVTVTVKPASGYVLDYILMTPLGIEASQGGTVVLKDITATAGTDGYTYTFEMPAENVAVYVKLKKGADTTKYKAYLNCYLVDLDTKVYNAVTDKAGSWAQASFTDGASLVSWWESGTYREVPEHIDVTVDAMLKADNWILAAYVLNDKGELIPLNEAMEGKTDQNPSDPAKADATAKFTMPSEDVHIYVWFTAKKPADSWHTAVLTVLDEDTADSSNNNSGKNTASIQSSKNNTTPIKVQSYGEPAHKIIWVEDGETVTVKTVNIDPDYVYINTTLTTNTSSAATLLTPDATNDNACTYTVPNENTAAVVLYRTTAVKDVKLHVVLVDRDNPNKVPTPDTNAVTVQVAGGTIPALTVKSVTSAGARQTIQAVTSGRRITFAVTPESGYSYIALFKDSAGNVKGTWDLNTSGHFDMLTEDTTLEIHFFKNDAADNDNEVTLTVTDTRATPPLSNAEMTAGALGLTANADTTPTIGTLTLPKGTAVDAKMTHYGENTKLLGVLVTTKDGTVSKTLNSDPMASYTETVQGKTDIKFVLGGTDKNEYIASVSAVNLPDGTDLPTIKVTPTENPTHGDQWTVAEAGNTVEVTVKVPAGYAATLTTSDSTSLSPNTIDNGNGGNETTNVTFTMPANNIHVTVTYKKVRFTATVQVAGAGSGTATLTHGSDTATAPSAANVLSGLSESDSVDYSATADSDSTLSHILKRTESGASELLTVAGGSFAMPAEDVTVTAFFNKDSEPTHHIAYVTTVNTDGHPDNAAQSITNTSDATLNGMGGVIYTYGDKGHGIFVNFTVAAGYQALVTAHEVGTTNVVSVTQQGTSGNCTASLTMPDADVEIVITYYTALPATSASLTLRLVGHENNTDNKATLTYATASGTKKINLSTSVTSSTAPLYSATETDAVVGGTLDLDAWRNEDFIFESMTVATWNGDPTDPILYTEVKLSWNEYLTNGISLFTMPTAQTLVTVYYGHPYKATLFVIDKSGEDYNGGKDGDGNFVPKDTALDGSVLVPTVTMDAKDDVGNATGNPTSTTYTHQPIEDLKGEEIITATVDSTTMPSDTEIASVIASTKSGTVHLTDKTVANVYKYPMSEKPDRKAENVKITVILRDSTATKKLHTATVYKVGHDDLPDNKAEIINKTQETSTPPTTPTTLPKGDIWTAGYKDDKLILTVTTAEGYYAEVTAKDSAGDVPVVQWAMTGSFTVDFVMPDSDLDITVKYIKGTPPQAPLKLTLEGHGQKPKNEATVRGGAGAVSAASPILLTANGGMAPDGNPYSVSKDTDIGTYLLTETATDGDYYVKSVVMKVTVDGTTYTYDLTDTAFKPRVPVGGAEIIVTFEQGKVTGRPYDPEHSETYNSATSNPAGTNPYADGTTIGENPDLSVAPPNSPMGTTDEREGWILAESVDVERFTFVVTVPTLFDKNEKNADGTLNKAGALSDAGVADDTTETPPVYTFYWWDGTDYVEFNTTTTELTVTAQSSLTYADNPKGDYPKTATGTAEAQHYGYELTLAATLSADETTDTAAQALLRKCFEEGGVIYVTAKHQKTLTDADGKTIPWIESEKTQVIVRPDSVLKPYDPDTTGDPNYNDHWIKAENRGDYLIVTVPMLNNKSGDKPTEVDDNLHRFRLYLQNDTAGDRKGDIVDVTDLLSIVNVKSYENKWNQNLEYDSTWTAGGDLFEKYYENEVYYTDTSVNPNVDYLGARFVVTILTDAAIDADTTITNKTTAKKNAAILSQIFDNEGTMGIGTNKYRMYITSDEATGWTATTPTFRFDDYTDFEVPRYYTLSGVLNSWAPTHIAELTLYQADETASVGGAVVYETAPAYKTLSGLVSIYDDGRYADAAHPADYDPAIYNNRWYTDFAFKSSALAGKTYKLVVEKVAHIAYTHTELDLTVPSGTESYYDPTTQSFEIGSEIALFCGDLYPVYTGGNQKINDGDRDYLSLYLYGNAVWTKVKSAADDPDGWVNSIYNPDSYAYAADLDGNGSFSERDWTILMSSFNWKKSVRNYGSPSGLTATSAALLMAAIELPNVGEESGVYDVTEDTDLIGGVTEGDTVYGVTEDTNLIGGVTEGDTVYGVTEDTDLIGGVTEGDSVYDVTEDTKLIGAVGGTDATEPPKAPKLSDLPDEGEPAAPAPSTEEEGEESASQAQTE